MENGIKHLAAFYPRGCNYKQVLKMVNFLELQQQATECLAQEKYTEAVALYEQSIAAEPTQMSNYWHLGLALLLQGQEAEAQATWMSAMAQGSPAQIDTWTAELVEVLTAAAQRREAISDLKYALGIRQYIHEFDSENLDNLLSIIWLSAEIGWVDEIKIPLLQATQLLLSETCQQINPELLLKVVEKFLDINPFHDLIEAYLQREDLIFDAEKAAEIKHKLVGVYNSLGTVLYQRGSFAQAINQFQKVLGIEKNIPNPDKAGVYYNLGMALVSLGEWKEGVNCFQEALKIEPDFSEASLKLAWAKYEAHNQEKGYQFTQDWFSWNIPIWQEHLQRFANVADVHFLEIGSWEGRSTCWLLDNILTQESAEITCIDTFEGSVEHKHYDQGYLKTIEERFDFNITCTGTPEKVKKKIGMSQEVMRTLPLNFYDVLYIDGSHLASDVLADAVLGWGLVKVGGVIIFDDYHFKFAERPNQNTKIGIDAFLTVFSDQIKILYEGYQLIIEKISMIS